MKKMCPQRTTTTDSDTSVRTTPYKTGAFSRIDRPRQRLSDRKSLETGTTARQSIAHYVNR